VAFTAPGGNLNFLYNGLPTPLFDGTCVVLNDTIIEGKSDLSEKSEEDDIRASRRNDTRMNIVE
jgi:hypothetical protein